MGKEWYWLIVSLGGLKHTWTPQKGGWNPTGAQQRLNLIALQLVSKARGPRFDSESWGQGLSCCSKLLTSLTLEASGAPGLGSTGQLALHSRQLLGRKQTHRGKEAPGAPGKQTRATSSSRKLQRTTFPRVIPWESSLGTWPVFGQLEWCRGRESRNAES